MANWGTIARRDYATGATTIVEHEHHEIHEGDHYFLVSYQDLTIGQVLQFTFQTPNTTEWIHWTWSIETEKETLWQVYEGGTINSALANAITPINSNRNSSNTSGATLRYEVHADVAGANTDVTVSASNIIESGISGAGQTRGGNADRSNEIILKQNQLYVLRAIATVAGYIDFTMQWYEHTNLSNG